MTLRNLGTIGPNVTKRVNEATGAVLYTFRMSVNGVPRARKIDADSDADALIEADKIRARWREQPDTRFGVRMEQAMLEWFSNKRAKARWKQSTTDLYSGVLENHLIPHFKDQMVDSVSYQDVEDWHAGLSDKRGIADTGLILLRSFFQWALQVSRYRGVKEGNPTDGVDKYGIRKRDRYLTQKECSLLLSKLSGLHHKAVQLLLLTGLRKSEILSLRFENVDAENNSIWLPDTKTGPRRVPVSVRVVEIILSIAEGRDAGPVFPAGFSLDWYFKQAVQAAGLYDVRIHDLRHTFASHMIQAGVPLEVLSKLMGHASIATTQRYAHLVNANMRAALDKLALEV